jgi:hypothetical protein
MVETVEIQGVAAQRVAREAMAATAEPRRLTLCRPQLPEAAARADLEGLPPAELQSPVLAGLAATALSWPAAS